MNASRDFNLTTFRNRILSTIYVLALLLLGSACNRTEPLHVNLESRATDVQPMPVQAQQSLRIGMGAMTTPKEGYVYYQQLQKYIEKKLGQPVKLVDSDNYDKMNGLLESGAVDAAFICSGPYVEGKEKFGLELLVMPVVKGKPTYYSYIIVHKDSPIRSLRDLRGKVFAFTEPKSNSGKLVPTYMLAKINETPESFFARFEYSYGHDNSIHAVAQKVVDGAAVDSLVWEYSAFKTPTLTAQTRVIATSEPYGIPPMVVRQGIAPELKKRLQTIMLSAAKDPEGKKVLDGMLIDSFIVGDDKNYDSIRKINSWVEANRIKGK